MVIASSTSIPSDAPVGDESLISAECCIPAVILAQFIRTDAAAEEPSNDWDMEYRQFAEFESAGHAASRWGI